MDTSSEPAATIPEVDAQLVAVAESSGLEVEARKTLLMTFSTVFQKSVEWAKKAREIKITSVDQKREMKLARETRLALRELRIEADNARKKMKEDVNRRGKAIDGMFNVVKALIEPTEEYLMEQEKFAERLEAQQKEDLRKKRADSLMVYGVDPSFYMLADMSEEAFAQLLDNSKAAHERKLEEAKKAEEAKIKAENERLEREKAEAIERERIRQENERLKREAEEREAAAKAEREKAERERKEAEENARKEREEIERKAAEEKRIADEKAAAALAAEKEKARLEREALEKKAAEEKKLADAKADEERVAREKAERELQEAKAAEAKRKADEEKARRKAEAAGDADKLKACAAAIDKATPTLKDAALQQRVLIKISALIEYLKSEHELL